LSLAACNSGGSGGDNSGNTDTNTTGGTLTLVAGNTSPITTTSSPFGNADGTGANALFFNISGVAAFGSIVYVADTNNHALRKVDAQGTVTTVLKVSDAASAPLDMVNSAAVDASGNVYVGDEMCPVNPTGTPCTVGIHRVAPDGTVTTIHATGSSDNTGTVPQALADLAVDSAGNLFIADNFGFHPAIRKLVPSTGDLTTVYAGSADSISVAKSGNIYFRSRTTISRLASGTATVIAGSGATGYADGTGAAAIFGNNGKISVDDNENLYVADTDNNVVRKVTPAGVVTTIAGSPFNNSFQLGPLPGVMNKPSSVSVSGPSNLYVGTPSAVLLVTGRP
jgi:sugar lactone lactonase YvrE